MIIEIIIPSVLNIGIKIKKQVTLMILHNIDSISNDFSLSKAINAMWIGIWMKYIDKNNEYFLIYSIPISFPYKMFVNNFGNEKIIIIDNNPIEKEIIVNLKNSLLLLI